MVRHATLTVLLVLLALLALTPAAAARVSIVPGAVPGGDTRVFAFRLANERADTTTTRLELTFPQDPPIAFAQVAGVKGWTATITPRGKAVGSIVLSGGSVAPMRFEQFLITLGPLPADGRLALDAVQTYANGQTESWAGASAPTITIGPGNVAGAPPVGGAANPGPGLESSAPAPAGLSGTAVVWLALAMAVAFIALVGIRTRLLVSRDREPDDPDAHAHPEQEAVAR